MSWGVGRGMVCSLLKELVSTILGFIVTVRSRDGSFDVDCQSKTA